MFCWRRWALKSLVSPQVPSLWQALGSICVLSLGTLHTIWSQRPCCVIQASPVPLRGCRLKASGGTMLMDSIADIIMVSHAPSQIRSYASNQEKSSETSSVLGLSAVLWTVVLMLLFVGKRVQQMNSWFTPSSNGDVKLWRAANQSGAQVAVRSPAPGVNMESKRSGPTMDINPLPQIVRGVVSLCNLLSPCAQ